MDIFDRAQELEELYRQNALKNHFAKKTTRHAPGCAVESCLDCGEEINPKRLAANPEAVRCIGCQTKKEREEQHDP